MFGWTRYSLFTRSCMTTRNSELDLKNMNYINRFRIDQHTLFNGLIVYVGDCASKLRVS